MLSLNKNSATEIIALFLFYCLKINLALVNKFYKIDYLETKNSILNQD